MGCFVAPVTEAVIVTAAALVVRAREKKTMDKSQALAKEEKKECVSTRLFRSCSLFPILHSSK